MSFLKVVVSILSSRLSWVPKNRRSEVGGRGGNGKRKFKAKIGAKEKNRETRKWIWKQMRPREKLGNSAEMMAVRPKDDLRQFLTPGASRVKSKIPCGSHSFVSLSPTQSKNLDSYNVSFCWCHVSWFFADLMPFLSFFWRLWWFWLSRDLNVAARKPTVWTPTVWKPTG